MSMTQAMVHELQYEGANTRKILELIPEDKMDYKPHEKSYSMGDLGSHLAESLAWMKPTIEMDVFDMDPNYQRFVASSKSEMLEAFDKNLAEALEILGKASDEAMMNNWTMKMGDQVLMEMPRGAVVRSFMLNHTIHHRAQLGVYLRLNDVPLPKIYGPTADDPTM